MKRSSRVLASFALLVFAISAAVSAAAKDARPTAHLDFLVVRSSNGKPLRNASVIVHPVHKDGSQATSGIQLKTDNDGRAQLDDIPYGKLRVQAIAHGYQTYGEDFDVNQPTHQFTIRLNPPQEQYSIYK